MEPALFEVDGVGTFKSRHVTPAGLRLVLEVLSNDEALKLLAALRDPITAIVAKSEERNEAETGAAVLELLMTDVAKIGIIWTRVAPRIFCALATPTDDKVPVDQDTGLVLASWAERELPLGADFAAMSAAQESGAFSYLLKHAKNWLAPLLTQMTAAAGTETEQPSES